jgi:hypothetical protein
MGRLERSRAVKIKYRLEVWGASVVLQFLEMDERARGFGSFVCASGRKVNSRSQPEIDGVDIFLPGEESKKDRVVLVENYISHEEAIAETVKIRADLKDWAANAPCFQSAAPAADDRVEGVFTEE